MQVVEIFHPHAYDNEMFEIQDYFSLKRSEVIISEKSPLDLSNISGGSVNSQSCHINSI